MNASARASALVAPATVALPARAPPAPRWSECADSRPSLLDGGGQESTAHAFARIAVAPGSLPGGGGAPLPPPTRRFMEGRFGHDFSSVRIHSGPEAAGAAGALVARAFTVGRDVVFNRGEYQPQSEAGGRLLAHELAHVVQQERLPSPVIQRSPCDGASKRLILQKYPKGRQDFLYQQEHFDAARRFAQMLAEGDSKDVLEIHGYGSREEANWVAGSRANVAQNVLAPKVKNPIQKFAHPGSQEFGANPADNQRVELCVKRAPATAPPEVNPPPEARPPARGEPAPGAGDGMTTEQLWEMLRRGSSQGPRFPLRTPEEDARREAARRHHAHEQHMNTPEFWRQIAQGQREREQRDREEAEEKKRRESERELLKQRYQDMWRRAGVTTPQTPMFEGARVVGELALGPILEAIDAITDPVGWILRKLGLDDLADAWDVVSTALSILSLGGAIWKAGRRGLTLAASKIAGKLAQSEAKVAGALARIGTLEADAPALKQALAKLRSGTPLAREEALAVEKAERELGIKIPRDAAEGAAAARSAGRAAAGAARARLPASWAGTCRLGSVICNSPRQMVAFLDQEGIKTLPYPTRGNLPLPSGVMRLRGELDPFYQQHRAIVGEPLRRIYLAEPQLWTPEFKVAYQAAGKRWPVDLNGAPWEVHHVWPLDFGGTMNPRNLAALQAAVHLEYTNYWNALKLGMRESWVRAGNSFETWERLLAGEASIHLR